MGFGAVRGVVLCLGGEGARAVRDNVVMYLSSLCICVCVCNQKVFRPLDFFHILLFYNLNLKCIPKIFFLTLHVTPFSPQFRGIQLFSSYYLFSGTTPIRARERRRLKVMRPPIHNPTKPHCFLTQLHPTQKPATPMCRRKHCAPGNLG